MMKLQDDCDPIWGPFIYDGDESESIKSLQEHMQLSVSCEEVNPDFVNLNQD